MPPVEFRDPYSGNIKKPRDRTACSLGAKNPAYGEPRKKITADSKFFARPFLECRELRIFGEFFE